MPGGSPPGSGRTRAWCAPPCPACRTRRTGSPPPLPRCTARGTRQLARERRGRSQRSRGTLRAAPGSSCPTAGSQTVRGAANCLARTAGPGELLPVVWQAVPGLNPRSKPARLRPSSAAVSSTTYTLCPSWKVSSSIFASVTCTRRPAAGLPLAVAAALPRPAGLPLACGLAAGLAAAGLEPLAGGLAAG